MVRRIAVIAGLVALVVSAGARMARADGARDLEDGIAFYENLDLDRARERLVAAAAAPALPRSGRAKAHLYLGMLEFELGEASAADAHWLKAFGYDRNLDAPSGTSPKTIAAMESARRRAKPLPDPATAPVDPASPIEAPPPEAPPPPTALPPPAAPAPPPALVTAPPPTEEDDSGPWLWVGVGAGVAAVAGAVVLGILLSGGGAESECPGGLGGGCITVNLP